MKASLSNFTETYNLAECRSFIWTMVETCLTSNHFSFSEASDNARIFYRGTGICKNYLKPFMYLPNPGQANIKARSKIINILKLLYDK
jgi:hypothetical protein